MMKSDHKRIFGMLRSGQEELMRLGIILALSSGEHEQLFQSFLSENPHLMVYEPLNVSVVVPSGLSGTIFMKNNTGIILAGTYMRPATDRDIACIRRVDYWNRIVNLDNYET